MPNGMPRDRLVRVQRHRNLAPVAAEGFIGCVVDDFLDDVQRIFRARVHAGPLLDRLKALQHLDRRFAIRSGGLFRRHGWLWSVGPSLSTCPVDICVDNVLSFQKKRNETTGSRGVPT
jgi:hypothetical protein